MDTIHYSIPISMLRQFCFCPRIVYFYLVRQIVPFENDWVRQGINEHQRQSMLNKRRNLSRYGIKSDNWQVFQNVELSSERENLHGICDTVIRTPDEVIIVEFKNSEVLYNIAGAKLQACAYSLCYEETFRIEIKRGFILYGCKGKCYEITFDDALRSKTKTVRDDIIKIIQKGTMPDSSAEQSKCSQCEFFNFCSDRF